MTHLEDVFPRFPENVSVSDDRLSSVHKELARLCKQYGLDKNNFNPQDLLDCASREPVAESNFAVYRTMLRGLSYMTEQELPCVVFSDIKDIPNVTALMFWGNVDISVLSEQICDVKMLVAGNLSFKTKFESNLGIVAGAITTSNQLKVFGNVHAGTLQSDGDVEVYGKLTGNVIHAKSLKCENAQANVLLNVEDSILCQEQIVAESVSCDGPITAFSIKTNGRIFSHSIEADYVETQSVIESKKINVRELSAMTLSTTDVTAEKAVVHSFAVIRGQNNIASMQCLNLLLKPEEDLPFMS